MISIREIRKFTDEMAREFRPRRITLFGSFAKGKAREDSDVDLLVEMHFSGSELAVAGQIIKKINPRFAVDLIVRTPEQVRQRLEWKDPLIQEAVTQGKVLYESADA